ncbi:hypothetical protein HOO65_020278 [Ceratocystis lukuohia]|uniref:Uncharacterized protein n=1 Tax=Ceratocystis lukuohia TaxID=2019550 RepID=A0ABR4MNA7_9PEZI
MDASVSATSSSRPGEWASRLETEDIVVVPGSTPNAASPSTPQNYAMSRFEFETGHGSSDGTKILMVEWESDSTEDRNSTWSIDWDGKTASFAAWDKNADPGLLRAYILLPPGASIPPLVTITRMDSPASNMKTPVPTTASTVTATPGTPAMITPVSATEQRQKSEPKEPSATPAPTPITTTVPAVPASSSSSNPPVQFTAKPLPAIFAAGLGNSQLEAGKRGVLHTIWAKLRLTELQAEIHDERCVNGESVGLEMAMQEYRWLASHFGLTKMFTLDNTAQCVVASSPANPANSKMSGARQQTTTASAGSKQTGPSVSPVGNRLTEKLKGLKLATSPSDLASLPSLRSTIMQGRAMSPAAAADIRGAASLDSVLNGLVAPSALETIEDELFALPMSPRSPEMKRSPFSVLY